MCRTCGCEWYRNPQWVAYEPESAELLAMCVRRDTRPQGLPPRRRELDLDGAASAAVAHDADGGARGGRSASDAAVAVVVEYAVKHAQLRRATRWRPRTSGRPRCRCASARSTRARCSRWSSVIPRRQRLAAGAGVRRTPRAATLRSRSTRAAAIVGHLKALAACRVTVSGARAGRRQRRRRRAVQRPALVARRGGGSCAARIWSCCRRRLRPRACRIGGSRRSRALAAAASLATRRRRRTAAIVPAGARAAAPSAPSRRARG